MRVKKFQVGPLVALMVATVIFPPSFLNAAPVRNAKPKAAAVRWATYRSRILGVQVSVPAAWVAKKSDKALGFVTPGPADERAAVGVMKSALPSMEDAAAQQLREGGDGWSQSNARVAGFPAIKVIGAAKDDPGRKIVQYYIQSPNGIYLVQCMAPAHTWHLYSPLFNTMLAKMEFLP